MGEEVGGEVVLIVIMIPAFHNFLFVLTHPILIILSSYWGKADIHSGVYSIRSFPICWIDASRRALFFNEESS